MDEIKSKVDIVEVISSYVPLKRAGRNLSGLCPFHSEKTPSFMVSPERQAFKCFGCGEGGDVFTFLEKIEGWDFRETLEELAKRAGVKLKDFRPSGVSRDKEKLISINKLAAKFYKYILQKHKLGEPGRQYLKKRGIGQDLWEKFDIGFSPGGWENMSKFMAKKGYQLSDIAIAGLVISRQTRSDSGYYDRFRERLMFPIKDSRGVVMGFSGRLLSENAKEAKYVNSPETPIFHKGSLLFGLDLARSAIREKNEAVLVEGEFDVLSAVKAGVVNVVASKGTALTDAQIAALSRLCEKVVLCFDTDSAGDVASRRGIELMDISGLTVNVIEMGKYKDPDEFAQNDAPGFKKAISSAVNIYDYFIDSAAKRFDATNADGKKKIGKEVIPFIAKITDDIVRAHYISKLSKLLDLDPGLVSDAVSKKAVNFTVPAITPDSGTAVAGKLTQEEYFLALLLFHDEILQDIISMVSVDDFVKEEARSLFLWIRDRIKNSPLRSAKQSFAGRAKFLTFSSLLKHLPKDLSGFVDGLYLVNIAPDFSEKELWANEAIKTARMIKKTSLKRKLSQISKELAVVQEAKNEKEISKLLSKFAKVSEDVKKVATT